MSAPVSSTSIVESAVIAAPLSSVWHKIKLGDFAAWYSALSSSEVAKDSSEEVDVFNWKFKDGTSLLVKQEEHSAIDHLITYSIVSAEPALTFTSSVSTIRLWPVTSGASEGSTFVTWSSHFSNDADAGVLQDARFKRKDTLADLAKSVAK